MEDVHTRIRILIINLLQAELSDNIFEYFILIFPKTEVCLHLLYLLWDGFEEMGKCVFLGKIR